MDPKGNRHTLRGLEGQRLIDVLVDNMNELDLDDSASRHVSLPRYTHACSRHLQKPSTRL